MPFEFLSLKSPLYYTIQGTFRISVFHLFSHALHLRLIRRFFSSPVSSVPPVLFRLLFVYNVNRQTDIQKESIIPYFYQKISCRIFILYQLFKFLIHFFIAPAFQLPQHKLYFFFDNCIVVLDVICGFLTVNSGQIIIFC